MLGVPPAATDDEIRDAYRRLARVRHPDRTGGDTGPMAALNEAYRVLGDRDRRATYDAGRRSAAPGPVAAPAPRVPRAAEEPARRPAPDGPARFPWKLSLLAAGVGALVVLVFAALNEPAGPAPPDNLLQPGSCVEKIESERSVYETACDESSRFRVRQLVPAGDACPTGTEAYRDRQGLGTACVESI